MHRVVRILASDDVYGGAEFTSPFVLGRVLDVREDDKGGDILVYGDAIYVEAGRFGLESLDIRHNLCCKLNIMLRMFFNWLWISEVAGRLVPLAVVLKSLLSW